MSTLQEIDDDEYFIRVLFEEYHVRKDNVRPKALAPAHDGKLSLIRENLHSLSDCIPIGKRMADNSGRVLWGFLKIQVSLLKEYHLDSLEHQPVDDCYGHYNLIYSDAVNKGETNDPANTEIFKKIILGSEKISLSSLQTKEMFD